MIRRSNSFNSSVASRQRGDILTEALISVLLFAIAGVGISYIATNVASTQRDFKVQQQVVNELRSMLQQGADSASLCGGSLNTTNFATQVTVQGCADTTATVAGVSVTGVKTPVSLSATIEGVGTVRVGGVYAQ